ncbi:hypothetical protein AALM99_06910 [Lactococcus muris]|uniref:Uncharacterized protein n=1 Tax=Lactococcus muris TaxID=2941330 RepID=A0ABV4D8Z3_9LACT
MDRRSGINVFGLTLTFLYLTALSVVGIFFLLYWISKGVFNFLAWVTMFPGTKWSGDDWTESTDDEEMTYVADEVQEIQEEKAKIRLSTQETTKLLEQVTMNYGSPHQISEDAKKILQQGEI